MEKAQMREEAQLAGLDSGVADMPRWRIAPTLGRPPFRTSLLLLRRMMRIAPMARFTATAYTPASPWVLAAVHGSPCGAMMFDIASTQASCLGRWANTQDHELILRGYPAEVLHLLKQAAAKARFDTTGLRLTLYRLVPLPHRHGEILIMHPSGWRGRGVVWRIQHTLAAMAWQVAV